MNFLLNSTSNVEEMKKIEVIETYRRGKRIYKKEEKN